MVPGQSYIELMRILSETDDPVDIMLAPAKSQVIFHVEGTELVSRLIDGQFPNYQQVLPASLRHARPRGPRRAAQGRPALGAHRVSSAANVVKLRIGDEGSAGITIAAAADVGDAEGEVEATVEGDAGDHRVQRALPRGGAPERGGRPAGAGD